MTLTANVPAPPTDPTQFAAWIQEHAPHLHGQVALRESAPVTPPAPAPAATPTLTEGDVKRMIETATANVPDADTIEETLREEFETRDREREEQRGYATEAHRLITESDLPPSWKGALIARYSMQPEGPPPALLVEAETDKDGKQLTEMEVLRKRVATDLDKAADLIAEARGKPRVTGEGGGTAKNAGDERAPGEKGKLREGEVPYWRQAFADQGIVESVDTALSVHGVETKKVED